MNETGLFIGIPEAAYFVALGAFSQAGSAVIPGASPNNPSPLSPSPLPGITGGDVTDPTKSSITVIGTPTVEGPLSLQQFRFGVKYNLTVRKTVEGAWVTAGPVESEGPPLATPIPTTQG
jgi:hypothetical protein